MKNLLFLLFLATIGWTCSAQKQQLTIFGSTPVEQKCIDSIGYEKWHLNAKSVLEETKLFINKVNKVGYLESEMVSNQKSNDSTYLFTYKLGKKTAFIHIYIEQDAAVNNLALFNSKTDTITLRYPNTEAFLQETLNKLEKKGYALSKVKLVNLKKKQDYLIGALQIQLERKRTLDDIVINGYTKFPESHKHNLKRIYKNKPFNQENLKSLYTDIAKFRFVKQSKYPEILFTKDSTKVYAYLEKTKSNNFDGFIGFSNNAAQKVIFNGYIDLNLNNLINTGENFTLYWKSDGNNQKTFNASLELPYLFKSPFGLKAQLNIFKQDSTFQNTKTALDLGYFFTYNSRAYLGYQSTESSDIQNKNNSTISDFNNSFVTAHYEFVNYKPDEFLFPEKTKVSIKTGFGSRDAKQNTNSQVFFSIDLKHILFLNDKNNFLIKSQNYYLKSEAYIINELYRFGGINSIRGFNENSLQGSFFSSLLTEYRYVIAPSLYVHSIIDYGYYQDATSKTKGNLFGLGFGFGLLTKGGLFNIVYANGSTKDQTIKGSNSIVHISFKTNF